MLQKWYNSTFRDVSGIGVPFRALMAVKTPPPNVGGVSKYSFRLNTINEDSEKRVPSSVNGVLKPGVDALDPELDGVRALRLPASKSESSFSSRSQTGGGTGLPAILTGTRTGRFPTSTIPSRLCRSPELRTL